MALPIISLLACGNDSGGLFPFTAYSDCAHSTTIGTKYTYGAVGYGVVIYNDPGGTSEWTGATFSYGGYVYSTNIITGIIDSSYICYEEFGMYSDCEQTAGTPTTYFAAFGSSLALLTTLFTDSNLSSHVIIQYLAKDGITYEIDPLTGDIISVYNCYQVYSIPNSCEDPTSSNIYMAAGFDPSMEGGKMYTAGMGLTEISPRYYAYGGQYYYYSAIFGIQYQTSCST